MAWVYDTVTLTQHDGTPFELGVIRDDVTQEIREIVEVESVGGAGGLSGDAAVDADATAVAGTIDLSAEDPVAHWVISGYTGGDSLTIDLPDTAGVPFTLSLSSLDVASVDGLTLSVGGVAASVYPELPYDQYASDNIVPFHVTPAELEGEPGWVAFVIIDVPAGRVHTVPGARSVLTGEDVDTDLDLADAALVAHTSDLAGKAPLASPTFTGTVTLPDGTEAKGRGIVVGDAGPAAASTIGTSAASILSAVLPVSGRVAGDFLMIRGAWSINNSSGGNRTYTIDVTLGATTLLTFAGVVNSATTALVDLNVMIRVGGSTSQAAFGTATGFTIAQRTSGTATEDVSAGVNLDITLRSNNATATQEVTRVLVAPVWSRR